MKLYTEEQVRLLLDLAKLKINGEGYSKETLLEQVAPIELPSDEEIEARARGFTDYPYGQAGFIRGCQWVIEQIK
jgi:hypothetical protein